MEPITQEWIAERRDHVYRRTPELRVRTVDEARSFLNEVGFCHFWPIQKAELPNLFHAIAGENRPVPMEHNDPASSKCWGWKDSALDKRWWYYGKLVRGRATLVSLDLLPLFYACSANYGDYEHDYLDEYRDGKLSAEAKGIYEVLLEQGPLHTVELRKQAHMTNNGSHYRFEKALTELQTGLKILPVGVAKAGAWRYAFTYEIAARYYPDLPEQARPIARREAQRRLILRHLQNVVAASRDELFRALDVLGWTKGEFEAALGSLTEEGAVREIELSGTLDPRLVPGRVLADYQ